MANKEFRFSAILQDAGKGGVYVVFPHNAEKEFGKSRVPVTCSFDGEPYRGTLIKYGTPHHIVIVLKAIREKIKKKPGDKISVCLAEDTDERTVEVPADLAAFLKKHKLDSKFAAKSYTQRKEWVQWINQAKRPDTRQRRIEKVLEQLRLQKSKA